MIIEYASKPKYLKPNMLIYDTPGPNASKTIHREMVYKTLEKIDIAIFIIDYEKYLQEDEAEFLFDVANKFSSNEKSRSLIIILNKIDVRFNDANAKHSIIGALDFIISRIASLKKNIADNYFNKILIFPVCSLEYLNCIITEKLFDINNLIKSQNLSIETKNNSSIQVSDIDVAIPKTDIKSELSNSEGVSFERLKEIQKLHKKSEELHWLINYASNLEYIGQKSFSFNTFKKDSEIPNLLDYVSKVINYYSTKNDLISDLRNLIKQIENDNIHLENNKDCINEKIRNKKSDSNNSKREINNLEKEKNKFENRFVKLKAIYENDFCKNKDNISKFFRYDDFYDNSNNYYEIIKNKIYDNGLVYEMYENFFYFVWNSIVNLANRKSDINGNIINDLVVKYDFSGYAKKIFYARIETIKDIILNDLNNKKKVFLKKINENNKEVYDFVNYYKSELKKYEINFEITDFNISDFEFIKSYHKNIYFNLNLSSFNLYNRIKKAFEKTTSAILFKIVTIGFSNDMEAGLYLVTKYDDFRKIFDCNVKRDYCSLLNGSFIPRVFYEMNKIVKDEIIAQNLELINSAVRQVRNYSLHLNEDLKKLDNDVNNRLNEYKKEIDIITRKIGEISKNINQNDEIIKNLSTDVKSITYLYKTITYLTNEIKSFDKEVNLIHKQEANLCRDSHLGITHDKNKEKQKLLSLKNIILVIIIISSLYLAYRFLAFYYQYLFIFF